MKSKNAVLTLSLSVAALGLTAVGVATGADDKQVGRVGPSLNITGNGRILTPAGRMTTVGNFPSGSALTPDGKFLWTVSSGHGKNDVRIVRLSDGVVTQTLPLPGGYGGVAITPDGKKAFVSGESRGNSPANSSFKAESGDAIHVYSINTANGFATEGTPVAVPQDTSGGKSFPAKLATSPNGKLLAVTLLQTTNGLLGSASRNQGSVALYNISGAAPTLIKKLGLDAATVRGANGALPHGIVFGPASDKLYVTDERNGLLDVIAASTTASKVKLSAKIAVGGAKAGDGTGPLNSHPEGVALNSAGTYAYVAVANRDLVARVKLSTKSVSYTNVGRSQAWGTQPVAISVSGNRAFVANAGEDAIAVLDISSTTSAPTLLGRIPTAAYPVDVAVTKDSTKLIWTSAKGLGSGPNPNYGTDFAASESAPYGNYTPDMLIGRVGVMNVPTSTELATYTNQANTQVVPSNASAAPAKTALRSGGPIKHVFYIVRENRTYDQVFGKDPRGDGDPSLEVFGDNAETLAAGTGTTPNAHALAQRFPLLDHFYANSEVSVDGHIITSMGTANDYVQRALHANYAGRSRAFDFILPISFTPKVSIFDQAVRQGVSSLNYGESQAGAVNELNNDGRSTFAEAKAGYKGTYPTVFGCYGVADSNVNGDKWLMKNSACNTDSSANNLKHPLTLLGRTSYLYHSRFDAWKADFDAQLASNSVPGLTYLTLPNDHTNGVGAGRPTPSALVADNDLALGQFVDAISHSSIWDSSAIFVVEDDSQDGADHVDSHRMPAFVISPWTKTGAVVHTRYDQESAIRSMMILLGLTPLTLNDALAQPMYDAFKTTDESPDTAAYDAIQPKYPLNAVTTLARARAAGRLARALPYDQLDLVPQSLFDQVIWKSVYGASSTPPGPGPNASPDEVARAQGAIWTLNHGGNVAAFLKSVTPEREIADNEESAGGGER